MNQQTKYIVGAIFGALLLYFAYDTITNPNLDGVSGYDRCSYWAYNHTRGGVKTCQEAEMQAIEKRVTGYSESEDEAMRQAEQRLNAETGQNAADPPMQPTKM